MARRGPAPSPGPLSPALEYVVAKGKKSKTSAAPEDPIRRFSWIPLWGWALIFLVPLLLSEYMFYRVGRTASMILFPIAWVAFWASLMQRGGWSIFRKGKDD
jgi:hypothetical protein